ncbi:MAG: tRNA pseudouridine(55) synthase TruB [Gemmatimonadota bacterium]
MSAPNGVLPVDKPTGPTSHDVVSLARRALGVRRIGHTGTLDPFASGLLLLCIGPATRLAEYLTGLPKRYTAALRLGVATDTDDRDGSPIMTSDDWASLSEAEVVEALSKQAGDILQVPPRYSAKKIAGERMYVAARRGDHVVAEPVRVTISLIQLIRFEPPEVEFEVECSTGTYIRAIARDIGSELGVGAHLTALRRTRIGDWDVADAIDTDALADAASVSTALVAPADAVKHLPRVTVTEADRETVLHGGSLSLDPPVPSSGPIALMSDAGDLLAIAEARGARLQPRKVFA